MRSTNAVPLSTDSLDDLLRKCIESGDVDLPVLPAVGARVLELVNSEDSSAQELATLIQNDPALAGHVMRMANSAAFSGYGKIQTLQQGIAKLGMRLLGQMALTISVSESVFDAQGRTKDRVHAMWRHALASAAWSREIARIARCNTELAYLSGLLHQIGKAVALRNLLKIESETGRQISDDEWDELLARYHQVLGVNLAMRWQLPDTVAEAINYIDDYYGAPGSREVVMVVHAGRELANVSVEGFNEKDIESVLSSNGIFRDLNFYQEDLLRLQGQVEGVQSLLDTMTI
ncbi:MAG: HDOD domain-containing protein [Gammaproteobacteria bacterium]|nr:HDOD domain-containing protein [Gammaproteobacteria bacterium]MBT8151740.1 HDOD domain-containing protein [Gammaproteobacteria bacterium]NND40197.1 HDOD domain-containing protein [Pseudomonadales bacterium]NNL11289.1 HDOD domain-containing protein [Pseudomonadales bacterium]NNM11533.1 HDOD domain-containing protein [Pseudomonadales bacterium]